MRDPEERGFDVGRQTLTGRKIHVQRDFWSALLLQTSAQVFQSGVKTELIERRRAELERQPADLLKRAPGCFSQGGRCLLGLRERRRFVDRCQAKEDGGERGARFVVQLPRDPAPFDLLAFENRVDRFTRHAFREVNGEGGASAERLSEPKVIVCEAGIGVLLVEGGNDADGLLVKHERDEDRRQAAGSPGTGLIDLGIFQ